jgi:hypothetical protein
MKDFTKKFNQLNKEIVNDIKCVLRLLPGHRAVLNDLEETDTETHIETDGMPSVICYAGDLLETCAVHSVTLTDEYEIVARVKPDEGQDNVNMTERLILPQTIIEARVEPVDYDGDIVSVTEKDILPQTLIGLYEMLCKIAGITDEPGVPPYRVYTRIGATDLPDEVRGSHKTYQDACNAVNAYLAEHQASLYIFDATGEEIKTISSLAEED